MDPGRTVFYQQAQDLDFVWLYVNVRMWTELVHEMRTKGMEVNIRLLSELMPSPTPPPLEGPRGTDARHFHQRLMDWLRGA